MGLPQETKKSLELKVRWEMKIVYHFRREDFHPKPSADSVLVHFSKKAVPDLGEREYRAFQKFVEQGMKYGVMGKGGLLTTLRGKGGGYRLSRSPEEYNVKSILELMEGPLAPVACLESGRNACPRKNICRTLPLWQGLDKVIADYLSQFTLLSLYGKAFEISS